MPELEINNIIRSLPNLTQTQEPLRDQLMSLAAIANRLGLYDAADFVIERLKEEK